jgi:hypothetical protein
MTLKELQTKFEIFFNNNPVFCAALLIAVVVAAYIFYMQTFQHDEVLKQTTDMCITAQSFHTQPENLTAYDVCKAWVKPPTAFKDLKEGDKIMFHARVEMYPKNHVQFKWDVGLMNLTRVKRCV